MQKSDRCPNIRPRRERGCACRGRARLRAPGARSAPSRRRSCSPCLGIRTQDRNGRNGPGSPETLRIYVRGYVGFMRRHFGAILEGILEALLTPYLEHLRRYFGAKQSERSQIPQERGIMQGWWGNAICFFGGRLREDKCNQNFQFNAYRAPYFRKTHTCGSVSHSQLAQSEGFLYRTCCSWVHRMSKHSPFGCFKHLWLHKNKGVSLWRDAKGKCRRPCDRKHGSPKGSTGHTTTKQSLYKRLVFPWDPVVVRASGSHLSGG